MMIRALAIFTSIFLFTISTANAAATVTATTASPAETRFSAKKAKATGIKMKEPQFLELNDNIVSFRGSFGGVYDSQPVWSGIYEKMVTPNLGVGFQGGYSRYSGTATNFGGYFARYDYRVFTAAVLGSLHADVLSVQNLDTYLTLGVGHAFVRSKFSTNIPEGFRPSISSDGDATFVEGYINARYFFSPQWGATGSLGFGHGNLALGMDYVF